MGTVKYTGPVASFHCPTNAEIRSLKVHFSPKQEGSGDPSPENVREIVGWDGVEVEQSGKNLWGGKFAADEIYSEYKKLFPTGNAVRYEEDTDGKYLCIETAYKFTTTNIAPSFKPKPNTVYTIIFSGKLLSASLLSSNLSVIYTDGTTAYPYFTKNSEKEVVIYKTAVGKTIDYISGRFLYNTTQIYYEDKFGIFEGDIDISEYEPYHGFTTDYEFGVLGKNKLDNSKRTTNTNNIYFYWADGVDLVPQTYTLSCEESATSISIKDWETGSNIVVGYYTNSLTFTLTEAKHIKIEIYLASGIDQQQNIQLELGSTATTYEPYDPKHTVYGGWVDLISGEVVQTWISRLGSEMDVQTSSSTDEPWVHRFTVRGPWVSSTVGYENGSGEFEWTSDKIPHGNARENVSGLSGSGVLYIYDNTISTVQSFKEKYADTQFVYQLRSTAYKHYTIAPTALQTFLGHNNVWSNADYVEVEYDLHETQSLLQRKAFIMANQPHIVKPAAASLQNFKADVIAPLKECKVHFSPVQEGSGDASPDNVRAISGWTGIELKYANINLYDDVMMDSGYYKWYIPETLIDSDLVYSMEVDNTNGTNEACIRMIAKDKNGTTIKRISRTSGVAAGNKSRDVMSLTDLIPSNTDYIYFGTSGNNAIITNPMIEIHNTGSLWNLSQYEPYSGTTLPINWTTGAGTVYGGYVDLVNGEVVQTWNTITLNGTQNAYISGTLYRGTTCTDVWFDAGNWGITRSYAQNLTSADTQSNAFKLASYAIWGKPDQYPWCYVLNTYNQIHCVFVNDVVGIASEDTNAQAIAKVKTWLTEHPVDVKYQVSANKYTHYALTPQTLKTIRGTNNIWSNANGNIELAYWSH